MAKKVKKLGADELVNLIEEIRKEAVSGVHAESGSDIGVWVVYLFEKVVGKDWMRTRVELK